MHNQFFCVVHCNDTLPDPDQMLTAVEGVLQLGGCTSCPWMNCEVVDRHAALLHQFFSVLTTQQISEIPPAVGEDNVLYKMGALDTDHPNSPLASLCRSLRESPQKVTNENFGIWIYRGEIMH
jgi:hypothetical protein